ncbi:CDP-diacylglycerol--glycerol-3-phosphate 3-phosphatidyltransferase [Thermodesulfovibrio sp. N1]|nr:CDP-diacylglycerol--glycerol-3-phosphate 3-phosphatidyltransferase [Thermodesulfovibrio sp. N1]
MMANNKIITVPNMLTTLRIFLVPFLVFAMNAKDYSLALKIIIIAGITDSLDGIIARKFNQISKFGTFLDPLADKFLILSIMAIFYIQELVPRWFVSIVFIRDVLVALGWLEAYLRKKKIMKPLILGKIYNASQVIIFGYVILAVNFKLSLPSNLWYIGVSLLSILSFVQYTIVRLSNDSQRS